MENRRKRLTHLKLHKNFHPRIILDLGAHEGKWSLMVKKVFPDVSLFMVEANKNKKQILQEINFPFQIGLLGDMDNVYVNYYMTQNIDDSGNSVYRERTKKFNDENCNVTRLPMITLDKIISDNNINPSKIDLINFDLRGSEIDAMIGSKTILKYCKYLIVTTQILEYNINAPKLTQVILHLDKLGFKLCDIININHINENNKLKELELLFVKDITFFDIIWDDSLTTIDYLY